MMPLSYRQRTLKKERREDTYMRNKGYDDETLVMLTLAGEQNAYEVLVERYQTAVIRSAYRITGKIHIAEDVAQDAFVTAWIKLNTLREPSKYGGWVCRIARNCAINTMNRYQSFLPFEVTDYLPLAYTFCIRFNYVF